MKLFHVLQALYCEPWLIRPEMHVQLCEIVNAHISGDAHNPGGIANLFCVEQESAEDDGPGEFDGITVITVHGVIGKRVGGFAKMSGACDINDLELYLESAVRDPDCQGILLHIDSPGGTNVGVPEMAQMVVEAAAVKPVVAFTDKQMASAAYYLAAGADAIYATPSAAVGCIGVYMALLDRKRQAEMQGINVEVFKHGFFKGMGIPGTSLNDRQREFLQDKVEQIYESFAGFVSEHREVPMEAMEGQWYHNEEAVSSFMVDAIGDIHDAIQEIRDLIKLRNGDDDEIASRDPASEEIHEFVNSQGGDVGCGG